MDELPVHAKQLLAQARLAEDPPAGARERVREGVALAVGVGVAAAAGTAASHASASSVASLGAKAGWLASTAGKLVLVGGVITALGTTALVLRPTHEIERAAKPAKAAPSTPTPSSVARPVQVPGVPVQAQSALLPASAPATARPEPHVAEPTARHAPGPARSIAPTSLHGEMTLLSEASVALSRSDLRSARALLAKHRRQYGAGQLVQERRGLEVLAACMAQRADAMRSARGYLRANPDGVLAARVASACKLEAP